jgi:hypothetical protein
MNLGSLVVVSLGICFSATANASEILDKTHSVVKESVSYDPEKKTTTSTVEKRSTTRFKEAQGTIKAQEFIKVKEQSSADGNQVVTTTEETYSEELE